MADADSEPDSPLNDSMGMILIGLVIDSILYGIMTFQTYQFYTNDERDRWLLRSLVALLWVLDTLQLTLLCHAVYHFLILNYGKPDMLEYSIWSLDLEVAPTVIVTFIVRCFFTARVWHLSDRKQILVFIIMVFSFAQLGVGLAVCVFTTEEFDKLPDYKAICLVHLVPISLQQASAVIADILISVPLVYYLSKSKTGVDRTNSLINRLIVWSINTALITGVVELAQLLVWVGMTRTLIFMPFHLIIAKLFTNCMLAMLNGRKTLRATFEGHMDGSSMGVGHSVLEIEITREVSLSLHTTTPTSSKPAVSPSRSGTDSISSASQRRSYELGDPVLPSAVGDISLNPLGFRRRDQPHEI
ncbi:hypothetical protein FA95DRAFT_1609528 [Auriscalpium vulgare]|uniref:Uncharacterized protein n=1 Tax=Auriscalpium vulgare TaxID=40419 RepID=A0ACB8RHR0_9AGAM|nr:hypothetical protein FA95DRAFT_1609528 [Auriscalpium vulgare]